MSLAFEIGDTVKILKRGAFYNCIGEVVEIHIARDTNRYKIAIPNVPIQPLYRAEYLMLHYKYYTWDGINQKWADEND